MRKILLMGLAFLLSFGIVIAQDRTVSGKVTSAEDGSAIPGVNVVVKGTTNMNYMLLSTSFNGELKAHTGKTL